MKFMALFWFFCFLHVSLSFPLLNYQIQYSQFDYCAFIYHSIRLINVNAVITHTHTLSLSVPLSCRLVADILNDIAICIEIMTPFFPSIFLLLACIASVTKVRLIIKIIFVPKNFLQSLVGVAGGATRAALVQHQARRDNMADVSAKDGSQVSIGIVECKE